VKELKGKTIALALTMMLILSISAVLSENDKNFTIDVVFNAVPADPLCATCPAYTIEDTMVWSEPGMPLLPYRVLSIALPEGTTLKDINVHHGKTVVIDGVSLPWGQLPATYTHGPAGLVGRNEAVYTSNSLFPKASFEIVGVQYCKGVAIANIHVFPVAFQPMAEKILFYPEMSVHVQLGNAPKNKLFRGTQADMTEIAGMVENAEVLGTYEGGSTPLATEEYIIITNSTLQSTFQDLATWKDTWVNGTGVYTVSWITSNYSGTDTQAKIRNFIIDKYTTSGTKYVLLGGDVGVVPYRGFYVSSGGYTESDMAADMYYAHLDGSFDNDGDGRYAESGEVDWYAEVAVGRAPVDNTTEAQAFVNKVIAYEQMDKPEAVMLHQSRVQSGNSPDARCLAWNCDDWVPGGYSINYVFEEDGDISKADWRNAWASDHIANAHIGHGNTDIYYINYEPTVSWYGSDVSSLTNTFFPWTTSVACISGEFESSDCLSENYVKDDHGAIGAIYNDKYGWFSTLNACQYSGEYCEMEFRACFSDGYEKLGDFLNQARSYMVSSAQSNSTYRWCFYERNLMGDPETPCLTKRGEPGDTVDITYPSNGQTVSGPFTVTTSTQGCIDTVKFYVDGVLKSTDTTSPFEYYFDPCPITEDENITIMVEGYCSGVEKDSDSVTVYVDCEITPEITITYPTEGQTVSGTVICQADSNCQSVKWYINGVYKAEDTTVPFEYSWNTTGEAEDANSTVKAEGYIGTEKKCEDSVTVFVDNEADECLGTTIVSLLVLLGAAGIYRRR
jgi:hypothetical protein